MNFFRCIALSVSSLVLLACDSPISPNETSYIVEILRDDYGVPHIYGQTDADAVYGMIYAQAEDDFPRIERNYVWATGRLAEVKGEEALFSDLRARLYMTMDEAKAAYAGAPEELKALCDAWAAGLNDYLADHPDVTPELLTRFEPWMPMFFSEGSIGGDIEQIPLDGIRKFYGGAPPGLRSLDEIIQERSLMQNGPETGTETEIFDSSEPGGSNGIALSGDLTRSGDAMLLINPHTSFYFRPEVHVVSEEGLNAYGAVTWGQFFVYQGFSEHNGWMHTSTYVDFIDEFVEEIYRDRDGELKYLYGDEIRDVETGSVTLRYKDGDDFSERTFPTYHTHHGPITHTHSDGRWTVTKINWDPVNALQQSFIRTKTKNHAEFREMMDIRTNSSNNTVYADADGTIAYYHGNFVPKRDPQFDYSRPVDGSDSRTDWNGVHTVEEAITITNPATGWIQNANSTPFTAAGEGSPKRENYPAYMAPDKENFRGIHAVRLLENAEDMTMESLIELAYNPALPAFEIIIPSLVDVYESSNRDPSLAEPIAVLKSWDYTSSAESVAMALAHFYGMEILQNADRPRDRMSRMELLTHIATEAEGAEQLALFASALEKMTADYGDWNTPWGEINRFQRLTGDIDQPHDDAAPSFPVGMASGRWGALAAYGARQANGSKKLYGYRGNSFVAVVEFGDEVKAKTLLAGGQSGDPDSPHFTDQVEDYIAGRFKEIPYYRADVEARAVERYAPGERGEK
ncbi:penicillin acylase family protein [Litorimonas sp. WD9-15]|uniref:penicillin acylase family protein n=1 Tax=Litorimonas sp. WD9-15 TaxID=3418716 RepID=UPI003CFF907A